MAKWAAVLLFGWGAVSGGFGAYALMAAFESASLFHAVQAGTSLLIATVSISAGFLVIIVGGIKSSCLHCGASRAAAGSNEETVSRSGQGADLHDQPE